MTESTHTKTHEHKHDGSCATDKHEHSGSCSTDKAKKTEAEKGNCGTQHKQGSCGGKQ